MLDRDRSPRLRLKRATSSGGHHCFPGQWWDKQTQKRPPQGQVVERNTNVDAVEERTGTGGCVPCWGEEGVSGERSSEAPRVSCAERGEAQRPWGSGRLGGPSAPLGGTSVGYGGVSQVAVIPAETEDDPPGSARGSAGSLARTVGHVCPPPPPRLHRARPAAPGAPLLQDLCHWVTCQGRLRAWTLPELLAKHKLVL